jgi:2-oxoglutarate ferredoxin oxidoreductase subunit gamma
MEKAVKTGCQLAVGGVGGQGVLTLGKMLAEAGMAYYKNVLWFPNYGASMRGGESECVVILSDDEISSPIVHHPQDAILMDSMFQDIYQKKVKPGGRFIIDSSVIEPGSVDRDDITVYPVPATDISLELGTTQVVNMVLMGAYLELSGVVTPEAIDSFLEEKFMGTRHEKLISLNKEAVRRGGEHIISILK